MFKKLSPLLLLLLCSSCTNSRVVGAGSKNENRSIQNQPPVLLSTIVNVKRSETVEIINDWNGYSDITPILRHSKLRLKRQELVGNAYVAVGGYGAAGIHQQQTTKVKIPAAVTTKFLDTLSKTPLQVGSYQPAFDRIDDYPSIKITVKIAGRQVIFSSESQGIDYMPWKVTITQKNTTKTYLSNSPFPARSLHLLDPYLDRSGIERIIQRRRQQKKFMGKGGKKQAITPVL
ncbi:hypothetical protein [Chamaesiphon sp. VAR_48_metabat_135_sub]|uniref:hypothetical protein n=1 Tax=Chamaesiphon sp. VAR_48_metabat_135_sub TaxID=2964699 RepID=UPI00286A1642|nr:hypothetical protein [Chamaesiphon sp. VAR_48_metabat_135_sub]